MSQGSFACKITQEMPLWHQFVLQRCSQKTWIGTNGTATQHYHSADEVPLILSQLRTPVCRQQKWSPCSHVDGFFRAEPKDLQTV